jgi:WD40 repeat protein
LRYFASLFIRLFAIGIGVLALSGCFHLPTFTPTPILVTPVPPATQTPFPTPLIFSSPTPTPAPFGEPKTVEVGKPAWIGRGAIVDAVFLPGGKQVAIAWGSGVSLDDVASGQELWFRPAPTNVLTFDVQPGGKQFAAALADGSILLFDSGGGEPRPIQGAAPGVEAGDIAWSPDGKTLAFQFIGSTRGDPISLLEVASGKVSQAPHTEIDPAVTPALAWSPDGSALTVASLGATCPHVVDARSGASLAQLPASGPLYSNFPQLWLPDGNLLAVGSPDGGVALLHVAGCYQARYLWGSARIDVTPGVKRALFIDPAGKWLAFRGGALPQGNDSNPPFTVWNLANDSVLAQMQKPLPALAQRRRMASAFDGNSILTLYESGEVTRWNFRDPAAAEALVSKVQVSPVSPAGLVWSADGSRLAFSGSYGGVEVWDPAADQIVRSFDPSLELPAFSADGHKLALFDPDKKLETIFELASGGALRSLEASPVLQGAAFSPDGKSLAFSAKGMAQVADLESTRVTPLIPNPGDGLASEAVPSRMTWSPDSQSLVTAFSVPGSDEVGSGLAVLWQRDAGGAYIELAHVANVQSSYQQSAPALALFNRSGSRVALQSIPSIGTDQLQLIIYDIVLHKAILTLDGYLPGAWVNDGVLLTSKAGSLLERVNVVSGGVQSGSGSSGVDAFAPGGIFTLRQSSTNPRGILILHWQEKPDTQVAGRAVFEAPVFAADGWSPDGGWIWAVGTDGTARIWPVK